MKGGPHKGLELQYYLIYDEHTRRHITVKGPYSNFNVNPWNPQRLQSILMNLMTRSNLPFRMTENEFLNMNWKNFDKITVQDELEFL